MSRLTLVALPIGNPGDLTVRALDFLREHRLFLAEDTRHFGALLRHLGIDCKKKSIDSFHDDSGRKIVKIMARLKKGEHLALVSDAGSPVLSDPAFPLVRRAIGEGHRVDNLPGVSAVTAALELSGLPPHPFTFHGFLPRKEGPLGRFFQTAGGGSGTHVAFESPRRIRDSLAVLCRELPGAEICVARELTKTFEEVVRFRGEDPEAIAGVVPKGEVVLLYHLEKGSSKMNPSLVACAKNVLAKKSTKNIAHLVGKILEQDTGEVYKELLSQQ